MSANPQAWSRAFRAQAVSDCEAGEVLVSFPAHASQATLLLQMAWEKLAKAALDLNPETSRPSHFVAGKFSALLQRNRRAANVLGLTPSALRTRMSRLRQQLAELESWIPTNDAGRVNAEYPWRSRDTKGRVVVKWPAAHLPRRPFTDPKERGGNLWHDFHVVESRFDTLFGPN